MRVVVVLLEVAVGEGRVVCSSAGSKTRCCCSKKAAARLRPNGGRKRRGREATKQQLQGQSEVGAATQLDGGKAAGGTGQEEGEAGDCVQEATEARLRSMSTARRVKGGGAPGSSGRKNIPVAAREARSRGRRGGSSLVVASSAGGVELRQWLSSAREEAGAWERG